MNAKEYIIEVL